MNLELEKAIKKYNRIYIIELFAIAAVIIVLATLKLLGIIGSSITFRHVFNIITLVASCYLIIDFIWLCCSKKRQKKNSWFDKITLLPFSIALMVFDIICLINWNEEDISYFTIFVAIAFYYIAVIYVAQGIYHIYKPSPTMIEAAIEEYNEQKKIEKNATSNGVEQTNNSEKK